MAANKVAVYWDFENLHAGVVQACHGPGAYRLTNSLAQERVLDVSAVMRYATSCGDIFINRAYNHWQGFAAYRDDLLSHDIDLIQLYPRGTHAKNGADIRLALDALEDALANPGITHALILGGDSDYTALAQKLKRLGKTVIGVGVRGSTNLYWTRSCHEFRFYDTLNPRTPAVTMMPAAVTPPAPVVVLKTPAPAKVIAPANVIAPAAVLVPTKPTPTPKTPAPKVAPVPKATPVPKAVTPKATTAKVATAKAPSPEARAEAVRLFAWAVHVSLGIRPEKVSLSDIGTALRLIEPDFDITRYGYAKAGGLTQLARAAEAVRVVTVEPGDVTPHLAVRPTDRFAAYLAEIPCPLGVIQAHARRMLSGRKFYYPLSDFVRLTGTADRIVGEHQATGQPITASDLRQLLCGKLTDDRNVSAKWETLFGHLLRCEAVRDAEDCPVTQIGGADVARIVPAKEAMEAYRRLICQELQTHFGETVSAEELTALLP